MRRLATILVGMLIPWGSMAMADGPRDDGSFEIRPKFEVGKVTRSRVGSKTVGTMRLFAVMPEQKFTQNYEQVVQEKCVRIDPDGNATFEVSMPRIRMDMDMGGMRMSFDSADDPAAPRAADAAASAPADLAAGKPGFDSVARFFKGMSTLTFTYTVDKDGKPLKLEGLSEGLRTLMERMGDEGMVFYERQMIKKIAEAITDDQMMENMRLGYRVMPRGKVSVGHQWEHRWEQKLPFLNKGIVGHGEYELIGVEVFEGRRCAKIQVKESMSMATATQPAGEAGTVPTMAPVTAVVPRAESASASDASPAAASDPANAGGAGAVFEKMNFEMEMTGGGGVAYVDVDTGDLVKLQQVQDLVVRMNLPADPGANQAELRGGMRMEQKLKTSATVELLPDEPEASR